MSRSRSLAQTLWYSVKLMKALLLMVEKLWNGNSFPKESQTSESRSLGQNSWYGMKGLVIRNEHVQYKSPICISSYIMAKV